MATLVQDSLSQEIARWQEVFLYVPCSAYLMLHSTHELTRTVDSPFLGAYAKGPDSPHRCLHHLEDGYRFIFVGCASMRAHRLGVGFHGRREYPHAEEVDEE